jgi:hypothetical protein
VPKVEWDWDNRVIPDPEHRVCCEKARPRLPVGEVFDVPQPLRHRTWTDRHGVTWRRRGQGTLTPNQARKLLARTDVHVMHVYNGAVHEHVGADRSGLVAEVEQYWAGHTQPMASFDIGELRDDAHRIMAMIVENC